MNDKRAIVFDLGKVLIDFDHRIAVRRIREYCALGEEGIYNLFFDSDATDRYERGLISSEQFFQEVKAMLQARISSREFFPIWNEIFTPHPGMFEVLASLHGAYRMYMVSNLNESHSLYLKKQFPEYFKYFEHLFLSYELHLRKPDEAIYAAIIRFIGLPPQDIIYTDDRPELVAAAVTLGIDGFVFTSTDSCKQELQKRGIQFTPLESSACPPAFRQAGKHGVKL